MATTTAQPSQLKKDIQKAGLAGAASIVACTSTHPIDTIKIRMQLQPTLEDGTKKYKGLVQGIKLIASEEGLKKGVYKGIEASWMRESVYSTLRLGLYEPIKRATGVTKESNFIYKFMAGGASGLIGSGLANPADLLKVRMQAHVGEPQSVVWHAKDVYAQGGIPGFWRGVGPTMLRAMMMNATKLATYDTIKNAIIDSGYLKDGVPCQFVSSVVAGFFMTVVTSPMDNIKTRVMNQKPGGPQYTGILDCAG